MPTSLSNLPVLDTLAGLKRVGENHALYHRLLRGFVKEAPELVKKIGEASASGNAADFRRHLHTLKGNAATVSALELSFAAEEIERSAPVFSASDLSRLEDAVARLVAALPAEMFPQTPVRADSGLVAVAAETPQEPCDKPRVLIVDDQPANLHVLAEALRSGHELLVATSARRALELAPSADLILLDVVMPDLDGLEVCRRLRADPATARIPIIFVTALEQTEDETEGFEAGAVDYIVKPIRPAVVRARVRTHLELKRARDALARLATVDSLTGIANRRQFDVAADEEWRRAARAGRSLTFAIADIDHFKAFNDRHGHAGGDACLIAVARSLDRLCRRPGELAARYGGEEFAMVVPEIAYDEVASFARRALEMVAALRVHEPDLAGAVSVSIGAAVLTPTLDLTFQDALKVADESLYQAKRNGRARAVIRQMGSGALAEVVHEP